MYYNTTEIMLNSYRLVFILLEKNNKFQIRYIMCNNKSYFHQGNSDNNDVDLK